MSNYSELLKDPRWQKKRLEVLALDFWECRSCLSKANTLHVHHLWYEKGKDPWEYPINALVTLCEKCHEQVKLINWKQAFLDLNLCEKELLEIAMQLHYQKSKLTKSTADLQAKYKVRYNGLAQDIALLDNADDLNDYYHGFRQTLMEKYTNG